MKLYHVTLSRTIQQPQFLIGHQPESETQELEFVISAVNAYEAIRSASLVAHWPKCSARARHLGRWEIDSNGKLTPAH